MQIGSQFIKLVKFCYVVNLNQRKNRPGPTYHEFSKVITRLKQTHFFASQKTDSIGKKFSYNENQRIMSSTILIFILVECGTWCPTQQLSINTLSVASDKFKPNIATFKIVILKWERFHLLFLFLKYPENIKN